MFGKSSALTWVTDRLAVGRAPMSHDDLDALRAQGISAILNLCAEFCDLHDIEREAGFEVYYMPVPDEEAPSLVELERALSWLDEAIYLGKKVLIHCRHGIGRTGTLLNAYLLRRGLGHRLAWKTLKGLRSRPANFEQWWTIRKYGRKERRLSIRQPSLEMKNLVDLAPFFSDYGQLVDWVEDLAGIEIGEIGRCGRDHHRCGSTPVRLTLIEAVSVTHALNTALSSEERMAAINRAVVVARQEREAAGRLEETGDFCLRDAGAMCPLWYADRCQIYQWRPLQCRTFELPEEIKAELWSDVLFPGLFHLSNQLFLAFASAFPVDEHLEFSLSDVVSGKYVERFFHLLLKAEGASGSISN
ncbi:phosphatase domain-containing putative toxin [Desulfobulbus alkaliphilus]|uniref:phosphatase domain-containing putative toxin n=1 Tax=Desulfobulbus alkaliphilus TaxID=869814 RepID=UPI001966CE33|nr:dual specificity protein phosphatase family protein [Desulfobulbus alkaliphilus]MBM9535765.1 dual specificity protein phosphatase family protein [Desulfobulbus alkaliphilus]